MRVAFLALVLGCGGSVDPVEAGTDSAPDIAAEAATRGRVCITDQINGAGYYVDGGCDLNEPCAALDGGAGVCCLCQ